MLPSRDRGTRVSGRVFFKPISHALLAGLLLSAAAASALGQESKTAPRAETAAGNDSMPREDIGKNPFYSK